MKPADFMVKMDHRLEQMEAAKKLVLKVGIPDGAGAYPDGTPIVTVGATHEYGATVPTAGGKTFTIPRRSFLRVPFRIHQDKIREELRKRFAEIDKGATARDSLERAGLNIQAISQGAFTSRGYGEWPDIQEATKRRKGSSQVLVDDNFLRGSITYEVTPATGGTE